MSSLVSFASLVWCSCSCVREGVVERRREDLVEFRREDMVELRREGMVELWQLSRVEFIRLVESVDMPSVG
jgi:hypothetical protein